MRYAITDIHGCNRTLNALLKKLNLSKEDTVIFLGDYIDRGADSYGVLNTVTSLCCKTICLKGNHEQMACFFFQDPSSYRELWMRNGGIETMRSIPTPQIDNWLSWMDSLPLYHEEKDFFFVHACFSHGKNKFEEEDMLWSRWGQPSDMGKPVISGHTPTKIYEIYEKLNKDGLTGKGLIIDNGCFFKKEHYGNLLALCLDTKEIIIQPNIEGFLND